MKVYTVRSDATTEDSEYRVAAESHAQAAEIYVNAAFDEQILVDLEEISDANGVIWVADLSPDTPTQSGVIGWDECPQPVEFKLDDISAWSRHGEQAPEM